ncbi:MAG: M3 family metallopeptidase [Kiritimatiellae bacterium]|nr:M3 family metallopeptidase [Kiritimatiellia bacterium]
MFYDWSRFTPEKAAADLPRLFEQAEAVLSEVEESQEVSWDSIEYRLDDGLRELFDVWKKVVHMTSVMNNPSWRELKEQWQGKIVEFSMKAGQSKILYSKRQDLLSKSEISPVRRRILEKSLLSAKLSGVALEDDKRNRLNEINIELTSLSTSFANAVLDATNAYKYEKGGKTYTIDDASYLETMKHCEDREIRENLYKARVSRAPGNLELIEKILKLRQEKAELLGFKTHAELSLAEKCAPSERAVLNMINKLDEATLKVSQAEELELGENLEPWDRAWAIERLRERKYAYSDFDIKKFFDLEKVLSGLWRTVKTLFDIDVVEVDSAPQAWHKDVRLFEISKDSNVIAGFYFDPFVRNGLKQGGAWMNEFSDYSKRRNKKPVALIVTNFNPPDENGKTELSLVHVETLFHEFGHALQCMLTTVEEEAAAGLNLVEWDAVELASQFMENWVLDPVAGYDLPKELLEKVKKAKNFMAGSLCRRQLAFAKIDWLLHTQICEKGEDAIRLQYELFSHFGIKTTGDDLFLCSFCHIFAGGYDAGYYGYKWAEVMSADAFGVFEDAPRQEYPLIGKRFKDTVLSLGGSMDAYEIFKLFVGREPKIEAMLRQQGLVSV